MRPTRPRIAVLGEAPRRIPEPRWQSKGENAKRSPSRAARDRAIHDRKHFLHFVGGPSKRIRRKPESQDLPGEKIACRVVSRSVCNSCALAQELDAGDERQAA